MGAGEKFYSFQFNSNNTNTTTAKKPEAWSNRAGREPGNRQAMAPLQMAAGNLAQHSAALDTQPREVPMGVQEISCTMERMGMENGSSILS